MIKRQGNLPYFFVYFAKLTEQNYCDSIVTLKEGVFMTVLQCIGIDSISDGCEDYPVRTVQLKKGDIFYIGTNRAFNRKYDINLNKIKLGDKCFNVTICIKKFKRKWWQFWKPRYTGAHFMVVDDI